MRINRHESHKQATGIDRRRRRKVRLAIQRTTIQLIHSQRRKRTFQGWSTPPKTRNRELIRVPSERKCEHRKGSEQENGCGCDIAPEIAHILATQRFSSAIQFGGDGRGSQIKIIVWTGVCAN